MTDKKPEDMTEAEKLATGLGMLGQLLSDIEDDGFWTDPDWEEKNKRDENGFPIA